MNKRRKRIKNWTFTLMSFTWVTDKSGTMLLYQRSSRTGIFSDFSFRLWTSSSLALFQLLNPELFIVLNCTVPFRDLSPTRAIGLVYQSVEMCGFPAGGVDGRIWLFTLVCPVLAHLALLHVALLPGVPHQPRVQRSPPSLVESFIALLAPSSLMS